MASSPNTIPAEDAYDVLANFMGPFSLHAVMARALKVPGNRFRLRTPPDSGGSFGVKQGDLSLYRADSRRRARAPGGRSNGSRTGSSISPPRSRRRTASRRSRRRSTADGRIAALAWDQLEDCGAHLRAPEPATLYRMHGNMTGAYDIRHVAIRNRVVLTNKTPTGLNRGFGGPQVYYRARAADAAHRRRTQARSRSRSSAAISCRRTPFPIAPRPARCWIPAIIPTRPGDRACAEGGFAELQRAPAMRRAPRGASTASAMPPSSSRASPTWATSPRC